MFINVYYTNHTHIMKFIINIKNFRRLLVVIVEILMSPLLNVVSIITRFLLYIYINKSYTYYYIYIYIYYKTCF